MSDGALADLVKLGACVEGGPLVVCVVWKILLWFGMSGHDFSSQRTAGVNVEISKNFEAYAV